MYRHQHYFREKKGENSQSKDLFLGRKWDYWKPWVTSKTPALPLLDTVHQTQQGLPIQQSCPKAFYHRWARYFKKVAERALNAKKIF